MTDKPFNFQGSDEAARQESEKPVQIGKKSVLAYRSFGMPFRGHVRKTWILQTK